MMKHLTAVLMTLVLVSCVKDAKDISPSTLFDVELNGVNISQATIIADNTLKYKVELTSAAGLEIDDDKTVTVSVSEGTVSAVNNISSTASTQTSVTIEGGKGVFYYIPGRKPQKSAVMSITLQGISQVLGFDILPLEPAQIQLSVTPSQPKVTNDVEVTAFLTNSTATGGLPSDNLQVYFEAAKATSLDSIDAYVSPPGYGNSSLSAQTGFVAAKTSVSTNGKPGSIIIKATYTRRDGTSVQGVRTVRFTR